MKNLEELFLNLIFENPILGSLKYRLFIPINYDKTKSYPLVIFLHGSGARGFDNKAQLRPEYDFLQRMVEDENLVKYPCFILAPQCPQGESWVEINQNWNSNYNLDKLPLSKSLTLVLSLCDELINKYNIDTKRQYLTGLSMGGFGTWDLISRFPSRFACAIPICGGNDPSKAKGISKIKIWAFHGVLDTAVDVNLTRTMVNNLRNYDSKIIYTEYENVAHNAWNYAYKEKELLEFMFNSKSS